VRVLMLLSTSSVTGPAELCLDDAKGLKKAGHTVVFGLDTKRSGDYLKTIKDAGYEVRAELVLCRKSPPMEMARDVSRLRKRLWNVDLVHCRFSHDHGVALAAMQRLSERPALVRTAETAHSMRPGLVRGFAFRACDAVIVSCQEYQQRIRATHRLPAAVVHVLPGRVDARRFTPWDAAGTRKAWGVSQGEVLFGIVSRLKPERLHDVVLRAFARVALEMPKAKLAIIGRGEHEKALRDLVTGLGLDGRVIFPGYATGSELVWAYCALDAKIWLAEGNDGTCRAVLEAMACGVPVVAGDSGAMADLVRDGVQGRVVKPTDEAVAAALRQLTELSVRKAMSRAALERAAEFPPKVRAARLAGIYASALKIAGR
jgi:L-malate glycosyltransferase